MIQKRFGSFGRFSGATVVVCVGVLHACVTKSYTEYIISTPVVKPSPYATRNTPPLAPPPQQAAPFRFRWNDGKTYTEVEIPVMGSHQRLVMTSSPSEAPSGAGLKVVLPPPNDTSDRAYKQSFKAAGGRENEKEADVSITAARQRFQTHVKQGNYDLALGIIEQVLRRYPDLVDFVRAKGSVLHLMGKNREALEWLEKAQDLEADPQVERLMKDIEKQINGR